MSRRVLVSWIGHTDLRSMATSLKGKLRDEIAKIAGAEDPEDGPGPIRTLLENESFDRVHLITGYSKEINDAFKQWAGKFAKSIRCHAVKIQNPSNHGAILNCVQPVMQKVKLDDADELCFHLSPGTPAMAAIWILLAKSKFPATLFQSYKGNVSKAEIPFDITVDVLPDILSKPDRFWQHLVEDSHEGNSFDDIVGDSAAIRLAKGRAKRAALFDVTVLILGETGTGKDVFANRIHKASHRRNGPFEAINCAAISKDLLESELFGHVKGAFTGADKDKEGAFKRADGGILFLDEVGECDLAMQAKILRALQPPQGADPCLRVIRRVGDTEEIKTNVRVIAATNRNLPMEIREGNFREDLFYRLSMITVKLPPLRDRESDAESLAVELLKQINDQFSTSERPGYVPKTLSSESLKYISSYHWPGNVRQLYNSLVQAAIMQDTPELEPRDIASSIAAIPSLERQPATEIVLGDGFNIDEYLDELRRSLIVKAMEQASGVKSRAASLLGMKHYQTLDAQLKRLKIDL